MLFTFSCGPELHPHLTALPKGSALVLRKTLKKTNKTKSNTKSQTYTEPGSCLRQAIPWALQDLHFLKCDGCKTHVANE